MILMSILLNIKIIQKFLNQFKSRTLIIPNRKMKKLQLTQRMRFGAQLAPHPYFCPFLLLDYNKEASKNMRLRANVM
jgi:hypothetical protein